MLKVRLYINRSYTQWYTTCLLALHGLIALMSVPIIAHFASKMSNRKMPRLACLAGSLTGSSITAAAPWGSMVAGILLKLLG
ncbi:hypothetical protein EYZ11_009146 [Aspergillus tanneri]|uniref:Major facilitator superfamily (MFS) profile domain-containing protein n=1 Tax=Aspergillus tanneri TaxID=1220188 RepID=A0A4S3JAS8_9EURO|nr:hypothetical protein EYZ11_009146 [Aspergillus tanneri]